MNRNTNKETNHKTEALVKSNKTEFYKFKEKRMRSHNSSRFSDNTSQNLNQECTKSCDESENYGTEIISNYENFDICSLQNYPMRSGEINVCKNINTEYKSERQSEPRIRYKPELKSEFRIGYKPEHQSEPRNRYRPITKYVSRTESNNKYQYTLNHQYEKIEMSIPSLELLKEFGYIRNGPTSISILLILNNKKINIHEITGEIDLNAGCSITDLSFNTNLIEGSLSIFHPDNRTFYQAIVFYNDLTDKIEYSLSCRPLCPIGIDFISSLRLKIKIYKIHYENSDG